MLNKLKNGVLPEALDDLRKYISESGLTSGQRLPSERVLTASLGLTRNSLRKALDALEREGVIWRHVGKGTFVANADVDLDKMVDSPLALGKQITPVKMMRARIAIEPAIAREAALNASGRDLCRIKHALEGTHAASSWDEYEEHDDEFHRIIAEASDNMLLLSIFDQLHMVRRAVSWGRAKRLTIKPPKTHTSFEEHARIAMAIEQRDQTEAYAAVRAHLFSVSGRLFEEV